MSSTTCPAAACPLTKRASQYLCHRCWFLLPAATRSALNRRDDKARARLLQLLREVRDGVPLEDIRISP